MTFKDKGSYESSPPCTMLCEASEMYVQIQKLISVQIQKLICVQIQKLICVQMEIVCICTRRKKCVCICNKSDFLRLWAYGTWLICDMIDMGHDSYVTWLICDMTHMWHD